LQTLKNNTKECVLKSEKVLLIGEKKKNTRIVLQKKNTKSKGDNQIRGKKVPINLI
jgi:hypothetical protein